MTIKTKSTVEKELRPRNCNSKPSLHISEYDRDIVSTNVWHWFFICVVLVLFCSCRSGKEKLFKLIPPNKSGIKFSNDLIQSDSLNILNYEYIYNGGGVAIGDFNRDSLPDVYFTGNRSENRLYLNKGRLKFRDITKESGTNGEGKWSSGVSVIDINNDGWPDIYVCVTRSDNAKKRRNILYVNQGLDKNGIPVFKDEAAEYGLDDDSYSTQAAFFDFDHDGDLDMYLVVAAEKVIKNYRKNGVANLVSPFGGVDKLFRNEENDSLNHAVFTNVSERAGITKDGYGLGINITDINRDGWPDIYVSNDYISKDLLWINNGDGTFTDKAGLYFKHTSFSAMGTDVIDLNNDGLNDFVTLDMLPHNNYRKKIFGNPNNHANTIEGIFKGKLPQYTRNTLQLNRGRPELQNDSLGKPVFSEIAFLSGIAATDWSWDVLGADFDNDGYRDLLITNGIPKDSRDKSRMNLQKQMGDSAALSNLLEVIPSEKISNYIYKNDSNLQFSDKTKQWGLKRPSYSNGAAWADLDNDGDLDLVVNNINDRAFVYKNTQNNTVEDTNQHWLEITFRGGDKNTMGLGATADIYYAKGKHQTYYNTIYRGYLSSVQNIAHFGLGRISVLDSVIVRWPNKKKQVWRKVQSDQILEAKVQNASYYKSGKVKLGVKMKTSPVFSEVTDKKNVHYVHHEKSNDNHLIQSFLPHKFSKFGPALAVGDVDGNGLEDLFIGGALNHKGTFLLQQSDGNFVKKDLMVGTNGKAKRQEDEGVLFFDANNDGKPDLYIVSGSTESPTGSQSYQDRLYINDGHGRFIYDPSALPDFHTSGSCVIASDYDHDGDLDLFVGGRVNPRQYPKPVNSYLLENISSGAQIRFKKVNNDKAPSLNKIGMVTDARWTDFNNDGWQDLVLCGEWMPVTFLENRHGKLVNVTNQTGISNQVGWWNSLAAGDFDNDGDIDYIVGNLGLNSLYQASAKRPVGIYAKDFNKGVMYIPILTNYFPDSKGNYKEFPAKSRDDLYRELSMIGKHYGSYRDFADASIHDIFTDDDLQDALIYHANNLQTCYIENLRKGNFSMKPLPVESQFAPVFGMAPGDFNGDGNLDIVLNGNESGIEYQVGSYDAFNGLLLEGDGKGGFSPKRMKHSGIYIPGDGRALVKLAGANGHELIAASQNKGRLKIFRVHRKDPIIKLQPNDAYATLHLDSGETRRQEGYYGSSYLSSSGRFLRLSRHVKSVDIFDFKGQRTNHFNVMKDDSLSVIK